MSLISALGIIGVSGVRELDSGGILPENVPCWMLC